MKKLITFLLFLLSSQAIFSQWMKMSDGITNPSIYAFAVSNGYVFAGTMGGGVFRTGNNGVNWTAVNNGIADLGVESMAGDDLYVFAGNGGGLYVTSDNGANWYDASSGISSPGVVAIALDGYYMYIGTGAGGVFRSPESNISWYPFNNGLTNHYMTSLALMNNEDLFAGTHGGGVFRTTNYGANWYAVNNGLTDLNVNALAAKGNYIFAGTYSHSVLLSTDNGSSWNPVNYGLNYNYVIAFAVYNDIIFASVDGSVFVSSNNGASWSSVNTGLPQDPVMSFAVNGPYLFAGTYDSSVWRRPVSEMIGVTNISTETPGSYSLNQNYPNPFNPSTKISFSVPKKTMVELAVYNSAGQRIEVLVNAELAAGTYNADWNATNYPCGVYFCRITAGTFSESRKMILMK